MEPRTRYYTNLLAGIVMLIVPVADRIKGFPASVVSVTGSILMAAVFFGVAIKAKRGIPRHR